MATPTTTGKRRRTKIVSTMGPALDRDGNLEKVIQAGVNVVRMNFSHGNEQEHMGRADLVRSLAKKHNREVALLGDLQGPKIRLSSFEKDPSSPADKPRGRTFYLEKGAIFTLDASLGPWEGNQHQVGIDYKDLPKDVKEGDILLINDGYVVGKVLSTDGVRVKLEIVVGGPVSDKKGINKKGGGLTAPALTDKDKEDIKLAAKIGVEYLAVSFPRNGADLNYARQLAAEAGLPDVKIVAKVERAEAVASDEAMDEIIDAADVIMVARGDLAIEIGDAQLPVAQKRLIKRTRAKGKVIIVATQMMESMIKNSSPTRAEVMDVANAIIDGTDAVMTSAETANGDYPVDTVKQMVEIAVGAETLESVYTDSFSADQFDAHEESIAHSATHLANHLKNAKCILTMTTTGKTALLASRVNSHLPIYALSKNERTLAVCALYRGVYPYYFDGSTRTNEGIQAGVNLLKDKGLVETGDVVIVTHGDSETKGATNTLRVVTVQ